MLTWDYADIHKGLIHLRRLLMRCIRSRTFETPDCGRRRKAPEADETLT